MSWWQQLYGTIYTLLMPKTSSGAKPYNELLTRGVEEVFVRGHLEAALASGKKLRVKLGIDPTGPRVHLGRAIPLWKLRAFQDLGHQVVIIIGDFTALVGDPSDKLAKRPMLTREQIELNLTTYKQQLGKILDLSKVEWRHNSEWLDKLTFLDAAQLAESFSMQQVLARRNFKERLKQKDDISLRELMYPLMQGYDSVAVRADLELGGFDQLFNLLAGRKIQERYEQAPQDVLTTQMLEGTDGRKMSTSWGNVITIADEPSDMYGKLMSVRDELIGKYLLLTTRLPLDEVDELTKSLKRKGINPRDVKARLAREVVALYHGEAAAARAAAEFNQVHREHKPPADMPLVKIPAGRTSMPILDLLVYAKLASSKAEARRLITQGGVKVGGAAEKDWRANISLSSGLVLQVGSRKFARLT